MEDVSREKKNKNDISYSNLALFTKLRMKKKEKKKPIKIHKFLSKFQKISKKEFNEKYQKNCKNNTFVEENININDWEYQSDNEQTKIHVGRKLHHEIRTPNEMLIYFSEVWAIKKEKNLRKLLKCDSKGNLKTVKKREFKRQFFK